MFHNLPRFGSSALAGLTITWFPNHDNGGMREGIVYSFPLQRRTLQVKIIYGQVLNLFYKLCSGFVNDPMKWEDYLHNQRGGQING